MKHKIILTFSKYFSLIVLFVGAAYSYLNHETSVIIIAITTATSIVVNKQYQDRVKANTTPPTPPTEPTEPEIP